jgi:hypothetical protein
LDDLSIDDNGVLKSPTTTVLAFIYAFRSFRVCQTNFSLVRHTIQTSFYLSIYLVFLSTPSENTNSFIVIFSGEKGYMRTLKSFSQSPAWTFYFPCNSQGFAELP